MRKQTLENYKEEDYREFIKNRCTSCGKKFENSWEHYRQSGNYCQKCNARINANLKKASSKKWREKVKASFGLE